MSDSSESSSDEEPSLDISLLFPDVTPIHQSDPTPNVAGIAYSPEYSDAMGILRALSANPGHPNALALTSYIIETNPAHYSVWACRRAWISEEEWAGEWEFTERLLRKHPKSYQVWWLLITRRSGTTDNS
jgi:protein farnesyltransferase/geranylgeranyltransferase type-1 subunit alpha